MEKRFADVAHGKDIKEKNFISKEIHNESFNGYVCLLDIINVKRPWFVPRNDGDFECILQKNFKWLEIYPENEKYAITAMLDRNFNVVEFYVDIAKETGVENGMPYIIDLYTDVVLATKTGEIIILDEDELLEAYNKKIITRDEYYLAFEIKGKILKLFKDKTYVSFLKFFSAHYAKVLKREIDKKLNSDKTKNEKIISFKINSKNAIKGVKENGINLW